MLRLTVEIRNKRLEEGTRHVVHAVRGILLLVTHRDQMGTGEESGIENGMHLLLAPQEVVMSIWLMEKKSVQWV